MSDFGSTKEQADRLILYIGDRVKELGKPIPELSGFHGSIGAPDQQSAGRVLEKLAAKKGLVERTKLAQVITPETIGREKKFLEVDLTWEGWELYEKLKQELHEGS